MTGGDGAGAEGGMTGGDGAGGDGAGGDNAGGEDPGGDGAGGEGAGPDGGGGGVRRRLSEKRASSITKADKYYYMQLFEKKTNFWHKKQFVMNFTYGDGLFLNGNILETADGTDEVLDFKNIAYFDPFT